MSRALLGWNKLKEGVDSSEVELIKQMIKYLREECGYPIVYGQYCWDAWEIPDKLEASDGEYLRPLQGIIIRSTNLPSFFESVAHELVHLRDPMCQKPERIIGHIEPLLEGCKFDAEIAASLVNVVMTECSAVESSKFEVFRIMRILLKAGFKFDWREILKKIPFSYFSPIIAMQQLFFRGFFQLDHHYYIQRYLIIRCLNMLRKRLIKSVKRTGEDGEVKKIEQELPKLLQKKEESNGEENKS